MNKTFRLQNLLLSICALITMCVYSHQIYAECDATTNMHYPTIKSPNYQGSAHTGSFDCAINGSKELTTDEMQNRADLIPPKLSNRFYLRLGGNAAATGISGAQISGVSNTTTNVTGYLQNTKNSVADNNFEIAFGYTWSDFAIDLEWLALKSISYSSGVSGVTPTFTFNSNIKGDALLLNLYWIFQNLYNINLYGDFIVGYTKSTTNSYINSGSITGKDNNRAAYGLGIGGRFNIISKLYVDLNGRYLYLGKMRMTATDGDNYAYIKAKRTWLGAGVCLLWLF